MRGCGVFAYKKQKTEGDDKNVFLVVKRIYGVWQ